MFVYKHREGGPFAFESYTSYMNGGRDVRRCFTVYGDTDQISHCIRIWVWED
jgi:hypothetical protein